MTAAMPLRVVEGASKFIEGAGLYKTIQPPCGRRKCIPPLVAGATTFPPQFGGAAKGKRLNGQARRLTSPHLEVLCRTSTILYNSRGRKPGARPGGVSRSRTEPWQPRAKRPGGWLNPHARKGVSTFGNTGKHRPGPDPDPDRARGASNLSPLRTFGPSGRQPSSPIGACP